MSTGEPAHNAETVQLLLGPLHHALATAAALGACRSRHGQGANISDVATFQPNLSGAKRLPHNSIISWLSKFGNNRTALSGDGEATQ